MAANSIIAAISIVPWGQVLEAAPKVAESASKLWNVVAGRNKEEGINQEGKAAASPLEEVRSEVAAIQGSIDELKEEMQAATMVIKALAEQNTALVQRVELNRIRLVRQTAALGIVSTGLIVSVIYLFLKQ